MSADDFQTKYASVMEGMVRSAIAETRKLFETMVDELKAEISTIKKENEALKTKCSQFEIEKSQRDVDARESGPPPGTSGGCEKRDTGVQCELVPVNFLLEHRQPLRQFSLRSREEQSSYDNMVYGLLKDHDYETHGDENSQMTIIVVKPEEEDEPSVDSRQARRHKTDTEEPLADQEGSTGEMRKHAEIEDTDRESSLPRESNQSSNPKQSLVHSLAARKADEEDAPCACKDISGISTLVTNVEEPLDAPQHASEVEPPEKEKPSVVEMTGNGWPYISELAASRQLVKGVECQKSTKGKSSSRPRRGRPPKKGRQLPAKEIPPLAPTDVPPDQEMMNLTGLENTEVSPALDTMKTTSTGQAKETLPVNIPTVQNRAKTALESMGNSEVGPRLVSVVSLRTGYPSEMDKHSDYEQLYMKMQEETLQRLHSDDATHTPSVESPPGPLQEHSTTASLQDAMLLVEAMNRSTVETLEAEAGPVLPSVSPRPPLPTHEDKEDRTVFGPQNTNISESDESHSLIKVVTAQQPPVTALVPTARSSPALNKIIVVPHPARSISPLSPREISTVVSTVAAAQSKTSLTPSPPSSVPQKSLCITSRQSLPVVTTQTFSLKNPSSVTIPYRKITIIVPKQAPSVASRELQSQTTEQEPAGPALTVREVLAELVCSSQQENINQDASAALDETASSATVQVSHALSPVSPPRQMRNCGDTQIVSDEVVTSSPTEEASVSTPQLACLSQQGDICKETLTPSDEAQTQSAPPSVEWNLSAVVRLTKLPFPVSPKESVLVSKLLSGGGGSAASTSREKSSSLVKPTPSAEPTASNSDAPASSADICSNLKEDSNAVPANTRHMSQEVMAGSVCVKPLGPSCMSALASEESTMAISTPELTAVHDTASEPTLNLDKETVSSAAQACVSPDDRAIQHEQSTASSTARDESDPHFQITKTQFLAQLAVSPVFQPPQEESTHGSKDAQASCTKTCSGDKTKLQKSSLVIRLRNQLKTPLQAQANRGVLTDTEIAPLNPKKPRIENVSQNKRDTVSIAFGPKNPGNAEDVTAQQKKSNLTPLSPGRAVVCKDSVGLTVGKPAVSWRESRFSEDSASPSKATSDLTPVSLRRSTLRRDACNSGHTKSACVSPRRSRSAKDSTSNIKTKLFPQNPRRSSACTDYTSPKGSKCTSVSPRRSRYNSSNDGISSKQTKATPESSRMSSSNKDGTSSMKTKVPSVSLRSNSTKSAPNSQAPPVSPNSSSSKDTSSAKTSKATSVSIRRPSSTEESESQSPFFSTRLSGSSRNQTSSKLLSQRKSISSTEDSSTQKTKCTSVSPKSSFSELTSVRSYTFTQDGSSTKRMKRKSDSFANTTSQGTWWPKLAKDGASPRKVVESTPKKPRLIQDGTIAKQSVRVVNAKKLAKAAKATTIAKMRSSNQSKLQDGVKRDRLTKSRASCETLKKCSTKAVWTPPRMAACRSPSFDKKRSSFKETRSPRSPNIIIVSPANVSKRSLSLRPQIVSPLQPLAVIGKRLLKNQCGECGRVLSSSAALESHVSLHTGHRPFSCTLCGKTFPDSKGLKRHGRVHRNGRIHVCQQCGKGFVYRFGLTKHLQMVHGKFKPFVCQICSKAFFTRRDVETHIRSHTGEKPFHCNLCEKKFARRVELNVHLRWHNGEKRHWCPYCGKGFLDYNNLKRHKYIHTGEKPHSCPHCPKHFTQSGHLKKHVKNVHKVQ